ncbi:DUF4825 domain-containing protein [Exiguobacterium antarcticum]|uniref:DUF4825 domain-containing protein n=1 Tax=Exiguobacterium antarcticum TaxID=132920 RepID=A0ABT6R2I1_9BACL|nr:DUF4825 domain-containing protein [Exiguobacterium antarcticum]MDI3235148.1 DUF4825 domain-containing protein [Exiguobacterium antarcticum]
MKRRLILFLSVACLVLIWNVYSQHADSKTDVFHYKHSVVGNNSAVTNIVKELAHHQELRQIALETKQTPYGIHLTYRDIETGNVEQEIKETVLFNATYLFVLVDNVDRITFTFPDYTFTMTRDKLDGWYNTQLSTIKQESDVKKLLQHHLKSETKINQFFAD